MRFRYGIYAKLPVQDLPVLLNQFFQEGSQNLSILDSQMILTYSQIWGPLF